MVWCVDVVLAKVSPERRSITGTAVHGFVKVLVLYQFDRIVSIGVVERSQSTELFMLYSPSKKDGIVLFVPML